MHIKNSSRYAVNAKMGETWGEACTRLAVLGRKNSPLELRTLPIYESHAVAVPKIMKKPKNSY